MSVYKICIITPIGSLFQVYSYQALHPFPGTASAVLARHGTVREEVTSQGMLLESRVCCKCINPLLPNVPQRERLAKILILI